jgi:aminomethyltransferase
MTHKRTILFDKHVALGARIVPFNGFDMPVQYEGILKEHQATRESAALFDTCHMGEFLVKGPTATADLERLFTCPVATLKTGACRYGMMCNEQGGVIDDLVVYRFGEQDYMVVVNAGTQDNDFAWISAHLSPSTVIRNVSDSTAKIDLQGPASPRILQKLVTDSPVDLKFYTFKHTGFRGTRVLISRTGYTGEIGFEFYSDAATALAFWDDCRNLGAVPAGLGARDTLRLEAGLPLYGHEMSADRNAAESGFTRAIATNKPFIGSTCVWDPTRSPARLAGIAFPDRRAARAGDTVLDPAGKTLGTVTSGSFAPTLGHAIALAYLDCPHPHAGAAVHVRTSRQTLEGHLTPLPFYTGTVRKPMTDFIG